MQEQIAITLKPERVTVTAAGAAAQVVAIIQNNTSIIDSYTLELGNLDPDWYTLPVKNVTLYPNEQKTVNLSFNVPANLDTLAGRYDYTLKVKSNVVNSRAGQAAGMLFVALPETINLRLKRDLSRGQEGKYDVTVNNRTKTPQAVTLTAEDQDGLLEFNFENPTVQLAGGGSSVVEMGVRLLPGQVLGQERQFRFSIRAATVDEREHSNVVEAQFLYVPVQIRMELLPTRLKGTEGNFNLNVANPGSNAVAIEVGAKDPDDALAISFQQRSMVLQPGTSIILPMHVEMRSGRKPEIKPYPFTVSVRQGGGAPTAPEIGPPVGGELLYEPPIEFELTITPAHSAPTQADYTVHLSNPSHTSQRVSLRAEDTAGALDLFFGGRVDSIVMPPGEALDLQLLARLRGAPPAQQSTFPFSVTATAVPEDGSSPVEKRVEAQFATGQTAAGPVLRLDVLPAEARGEVGRFQLRLTSGVSSPLQVVLRGRDDGGELQYEFVPPRLDLKPGAVELVDLATRPRDGQALRAEVGYGFEVISWVPGMGTDGATTRNAVWFFTPPAGPATADLSLQLSPDHIIGDSGQFQLTLINKGVSPLTVVLRGTDESESLEFLFQAPRVQLQPREVNEMSLIVRGRGGEPLPGPFRYPFDVAGWVPGSVTSAASVQSGELVVTEAPAVAPPPDWVRWRRLLTIVVMVLWIALPFILQPLSRNNKLITGILPLVYQFTPVLITALLGVNVYGQQTNQLKGWKGVLLACLGMGGILSLVLSQAIPYNVTILGVPANVVVNLILLPALIIVLLT